MNFHKILLRIFSLLFGDFNGVQIFLYPMTLFFWIDTDSFLYASTGLLTTHKYFFPLVVFLLIFIYVAFLVAQNYSALFSDQHPHPLAEKTSFNLTVIGLHRLLLLIMFSVGLIYLVSAFLSHFYGITLPLKLIYLSLARLASVLLILGYALRNSWTRPYREGGMDLMRAAAMVRRDYRGHQGKFWLHGAAYVLLTVIFSAFYNLIILNVFYLIFSRIGISPNLYLTWFNGFPALFYDIFVLFIALLLSNLLFSPLVKLAVHLADKLHPHRFIMVNEAELGETD